MHVHACACVISLNIYYIGIEFEYGSFQSSEISDILRARFLVQWRGDLLGTRLELIIRGAQSWAIQSKIYMEGIGLVHTI